LLQILLVDVYYVMNGSRGVTAAASSVILLLVGWSVVGVVYGKPSDGGAADRQGGDEVLTDLDI